CPDWFRFTLIKDQGNVPIIVQLLLLEFGIDALKMASLNTPNSLGSTFSIIGALILGEFAINAGWLAPEIILYMAFVALADFTQPSFELGYAIKFMRIMILILTAISPRFGFWIGIIAMLCIMISNKTVTKTSYFYPLFPFNGKDFKMIFARKKLRGKSSTKS
ncbi:MAG: spore germination protein, partial [Longicatena sp.]